MFDPTLVADTKRLLDDLEAAGLRVATAESCTGGLIVALLTELPGSSHVVDRGFVTYSIAAKVQLLGVAQSLVDAVGVVSPEVALAMAEGAIARSSADVAVAVTGIAGPEGGTVTKPVGLVHIAAVRRGGRALHRECRFGAIGRSEVRLATVRQAMALLRELVLTA